MGIQFRRPRPLQIVRQLEDIAHQNSHVITTTAQAMCQLQLGLKYQFE
jgi:hypothetical protein